MRKTYKTGVKVTEAQMRELRIHRTASSPARTRNAEVSLGEPRIGEVLAARAG